MANVLLDLAIHDIDVFRFLLNADKPTQMSCNGGRVATITTLRTSYSSLAAFVRCAR